MAKIATKKKHKKIPKEEKFEAANYVKKPYLTTKITTVVENGWTVVNCKFFKGHEGIADGLTNGSLSIIPTDSDSSHAIVVDISGSELKIVAKLKHEGGSNSCNEEFKSGL